MDCGHVMERRRARENRAGERLIFGDGQTERDLTFSWYMKDGKSTSEKIGMERNDL